jgi:hypothetical protein
MQGCYKVSSCPTLYNLCIIVAQTTKGARLAVLADDNLCTVSVVKKDMYSAVNRSDNVTLGMLRL